VSLAQCRTDIRAPIALGRYVQDKEQSQDHAESRHETKTKQKTTRRRPWNHDQTWHAQNRLLLSCSPALLLSYSQPSASARAHSHVIPLDHVQPQRYHLHALLGGKLALHAVRQDEVGPDVEALELALGRLARCVYKEARS
jgi:hypothetical protein